LRLVATGNTICETMNSQRPDLSQTSPEVVAYIAALEAEIARLHEAVSIPVEESATDESAQNPPAETPIAEEPPTTFNVITVSANGLIKRTPRHLYSPQRRGGMGIFDLETPSEDSPATLLIADESQHLIVLTNRGRAFRMPVNTWPASPLRSRGQSLAARLPLESGEQPALVVADQGRGYLALLTAQGYIRLWPYYIVGEKLRSDVPLYKVENFGPPAATCWTPGNGDLFIATRQGLAIRFSEKLIAGAGGQGIRLEGGDAVAAITAVQPAEGVFLLGADGRGTIRMMAGFSPNKAPGAGGKLALKTDHLVGAVTVPEAMQADLFIISQLSKIIRFRADEVPPKEGVVQGVNCMALRADQTAAICISPLL
jgi:DNA gyrase subunit A